MSKELLQEYFELCPEGRCPLHVLSESEKKSDATKRGRFNLGEKLVLSVCKEAKIETVGRTIVFTSEGKRQKCKNDRSQGSRFTAIIKMTKGIATKANSIAVAPSSFLQNCLKFPNI